MPIEQELKKIRSEIGYLNDRIAHLASKFNANEHQYIKIYNYGCFSHIEIDVEPDFIDFETVKYKLKTIVSNLDNSNYIITGIYHSTGYYESKYPKDMKEYLKKYYGIRYLDTEEYMKTPVFEKDNEIPVSSYALMLQGIPLDEMDEENILSVIHGNYPSQIMCDAVHFNELGRNCINKLVFKRATDLGYIN